MVPYSNLGVQSCSPHPCHDDQVTRFVVRRALVGGQLVGPVEVSWSEGRISDVVPTSKSPDADLLTPGFVDVQVNGIGDADCGDGSHDALRQCSDALLAQGVTAWCPAVTTRSFGELDNALASIDEFVHQSQFRGARVVGTHLEGPFLGGAPGAHPRHLIVDCDLDWLATLPDSVRIVTLAPESAGAPSAIALLRNLGVVVSLGHSTANETTAVAAVDAGATMVTHVFNGMGPLIHRDPGLVAVALTDPRLAVGLIGDGLHLSPRTIALVFAAAGDRVVMVSDAAATSSLAGDAELRVDGQGALRLADGTMAGSTVGLGAAVQRCAAWGVEIVDLLRSVTRNPSVLLGRLDSCDLRKGMRADLVAFNDGLDVERVWVSGTQAL